MKPPRKAAGIEVIVKGHVNRHEKCDALTKAKRAMPATRRFKQSALVALASCGMA